MYMSTSSQELPVVLLIFFGIYYLTVPDTIHSKIGPETWITDQPFDKKYRRFIGLILLIAMWYLYKQATISV